MFGVKETFIFFFVIKICLRHSQNNYYFVYVAGWKCCYGRAQLSGSAMDRRRYISNNLPIFSFRAMIHYT